ncbi:GPR1/FUN34/yaaH [Niveomyces insectorum RCEF 264]|uniref:GPR1/FUN34/yaaH n=1 Tax=Niveomyces insectorum RCEF 264 TaxID=1081102 RepID=A0A167UUC0_9HYPO|nr:GPR1/FUN34/yaaH [Niveomyces insectorum RCEF 264]
MAPSTPSIRSKTGGGADLEAQTTISPRDQPALPYVPRNLANPAPLGLTAFATSIFLMSLTNLHPRGVAEGNIIVSTMIFFGGLCQYIAGIMEFVTGNTFGATVFSSYAGFNVAYALIFIPGTGILAAYADPVTGAPLPDLSQAIAMFVWAWFIVSVIFTIAATRASWVLLILLVFVDITLLFIAAGYMAGVEGLLKASCGTGFVAAFLAYYAGAAGLWGNGGTAINLPVGSLVPKRE